MSDKASSQRLGELARLFFKLGVIGFGGPAAHIAMMEEEVVKRRQWLTRSHFLDLIGATNLIPGPNSTEMAIHVGYSYGGIPGLFVAGICFILPAVAITAIFAWIYVAFGNIPQIDPLLYGIKPAVIAVIFGALWRLGKKAIKTRLLLAIGVGVAVLLLLGLNEVIALLVGGIIGAIVVRWGRKPPQSTVELVLGAVGIGTVLKAIAAPAATIAPPLWRLGLFFLKVGCVLFGSGYVLIAFLEGEVVGNNWLTQQQLLDAIAIGQFTPGPVLSTSTFIGYIIYASPADGLFGNIIEGLPGAIVATLGIFLPSFLFVALLNPLVPKMRNSPWTAAFLDAVNVSAVGLMAVVTLQLAIEILLFPTETLLLLPVDWVALFIAILAGIALFRFRLNPAWLVLAGAIVGYICYLLGYPLAAGG